MNFPRSLLLVAALSGLSFSTQADWVPKGVFVQGGLAERATYSATAGVVWPWDWKKATALGELTGISELWLSQWSARQVTDRESFTQLGIQPLVRLRFNGGASPWFLEGGIGLTYTDVIYHTRAKQFSTRFNFIDTIGVGRSFGADRKRELSLRISHFSNAGIKRPNPGEDFLQLRYAVAF